MNEGLWTVVFRAGQVSAGGVVVLQDDKILGGDSQYFYTGSFKLENGAFSAQVHVQAFVAGAIAVFGAPVGQFDLTLSGALGAKEGSAIGTVVGMPSIRFDMKFVRRV